MHLLKKLYMGYNLFLHQNNIFQFFISMNFLKHVSFITRNKNTCEAKTFRVPKAPTLEERSKRDRTEAGTDPAAKSE